MSDKCRHCGSYAINPTHHGRDGVSDLDLCDVCYWRNRAYGYRMTLKVIKPLLEESMNRDDYPDLDSILNIDRELGKE